MGAILKGLLVNTGVGQIGLDLRERLSLQKTALAEPEKLSMASNDLLARVLLERLCAPGGIFVDVGAHIGSVIAAVARHSRPAQIFAVEAIPEKAAALRSRFPDVTILEYAVSDQDGEVDFTVDIARPGYSSLNPDLSTQTSQFQIIRVPMTRLDALTPHEGVDLIKIDVEGAELGVLRGAEAIVAGSRPLFMFESGAIEMAGFPKTALWQWFHDHGYEVALPMRVAHLAPGLTLEAFLDMHEYPRVTTNYFGIPNERRAETRDRARKALALD